MRQRAATVLALAVIVSAVFATPAHAQAGRRPNIILIQADDLGYGDLSAYGQAAFATPGLDRLAREGIRFTQYYAGATVCAPSRGALMTGLHTGHAWIRGNGEIPLRAEDVTIAMLLRDAGYRTAVIGKWGLGTPGTSGQPDRKGFDYSFGFLDHRHAHRQYTDHLYRNAERVATDLTRDYVNDLFTREAESFITATDPKPFFLYLNYTVPHAELRAPADSMQPFEGRFPETPFVDARADARQSGATIDSPSLRYRSQPTPRAAFAAMITRMDRDIAHLTDVVGRLKQDRNTLILFVSDNGPHREGGADPAFFKSSGGLRGIKRDLYEGGIRVPMIARWSGTIPAGRVSDHVWAHWDLLPTLAELAGAKTPPGIDGLSMTRALKGQPQRTHDFLYWEFHERGFQQAVRMGDWKAVRSRLDRPLELFDLASDPFESRDVAAQHADVVAAIERYLRTARTESARWPIRRDPPPDLVWEATGFVAPESVVFDASRRQFYVSNMGSWGQGATPGDGFISRLDANGTMLDLRWITGFENPKGLALANGRLYVADDADLSEIDPEAGRVLARYAPPDGPGGFNDATADPSGTVYVFSRRLSTVFRLRGATFEPWAPVDMTKTGSPNGLHAERDRLLLGSWIVRGDDGRDRFGILSTVAYADGAVGQLGSRRIGNIDGIEPDGRGGFTVTDWQTGDVLHVTADGTPSSVLTLPRGAADHHYVVDQRLLLVPLVLDGAVRAYRWAPPTQ